MPISIEIIELAAQGLAVESLVEGLAAGHGAGVEGCGVDVEGAVGVYAVVKRGFGGG